MPFSLDFSGDPRGPNVRAVNLRRTELLKEKTDKLANQKTLLGMRESLEDIRQKQKKNDLLEKYGDREAESIIKGRETTTESVRLQNVGTKRINAANIGVGTPEARDTLRKEYPDQAAQWGLGESEDDMTPQRQARAATLVLESQKYNQERALAAEAFENSIKLEDHKSKNEIARIGVQSQAAFKLAGEQNRLSNESDEAKFKREMSFTAFKNMSGPNQLFALGQGLIPEGVPGREELIVNAQQAYNNWAANERRKASSKTNPPTTAERASNGKTAVSALKEYVAQYTGVSVDSLLKDKADIIEDEYPGLMQMLQEAEHAATALDAMPGQAVALDVMNRWYHIPNTPGDKQGAGAFYKLPPGMTQQWIQNYLRKIMETKNVTFGQARAHLRDRLNKEALNAGKINQYE